MATVASEAAAGRDSALVERLIAADGSATHRWAQRLASGRAARRDLADAVHALCTLHGDQPGVADDARARDAQPQAANWLDTVVQAFLIERAGLAQLAAAAGPLPSTPGHAESEATILTQRHALEMLARSDRCGCASGAVAALVLDWPAIRGVLDRAADAFGATLPPSPVPDATATAATLATLAADPGCERAIGFGAQQLLAQHRGLWSLLEARAEARG